MKRREKLRSFISRGLVMKHKAAGQAETETIVQLTCPILEQGICSVMDTFDLQPDETDRAISAKSDRFSLKRKALMTWEVPHQVSLSHCKSD